MCVKNSVLKSKKRNSYTLKNQIDTNTMKNPVEEENKKREGENKNMIKNHIEDIIGFIQEKEELAREVTKSKSRKMKIGNIMKRSGKMRTFQVCTKILFMQTNMMRRLFEKINQKPWKYYKQTHMKIIRVKVPCAMKSFTQTSETT
jgi:hypothetical protein